MNVIVGDVGVTLGANAGRGNGDGESTTYVNSHVGSLSGDTVVRAGDTTTIHGAQLLGNSIALETTNLNVESLQDTATYDSEQKDGGFQITAYMSGAVSGSANFARSNIDADHASVTEQSGIIAGDDGYQINVAEHTDLAGGIVTSTATAEEEGRNSFTTTTLSSRDIANYSRYEGDSFAVSATASYNYADPKTPTGQTTTTNTPQAAQNQRQLGVSNAMGYGSEEESQTSTTHAGINTANITLINVTSEDLLSQVHTDTTTETLEANSGALANNFDAAAVQAELDVQTRVTQAFDTTRQEVKVLINSQIDDLNRIIDNSNASNADRIKAELERSNYEQLGVLLDTVSGALYTPNANGLTGTIANSIAPALSYEIGQHFKDKEEQGSAAHILAHTIVAGLVAGAAGNDVLSAAISAGGSEALAPRLSEWLYDTEELSELDAGQKETISAILSLGSSAITAASGGSTTDIVASSTASSVAVENNRQLHSAEITWVEENAAAFAAELYGENYTEDELEDARRRLAQQALREVDLAWSMVLGSETDTEAEAFLSTNTDNLFEARDEQEFRDGSITRYGDITTEISDLTFEEYNNLRNFVLANNGVTSTNPYGSRLLRVADREDSERSVDNFIDAISNIDGEAINEGIRNFFPNLIEGFLELENVAENTGNYFDATAPTTNAERMDGLYGEGGADVQANINANDAITTIGAVTPVGVFLTGAVGNSLDGVVDDIAPDMSRVTGDGSGGNLVDAPTGSTGNWDRIINRDIEPNSVYTLDNGHTYITDDLGRVNYVEGDLDLTTMDRNYYQQGQAGRSGNPGDDGGHLIASSLSGTGDRINIVPQASTLNRGDWRAMENELRQALSDGKNVSVRIDIGYPTDGGVRPNNFMITTSINGEIRQIPFRQ